MSETMNFTEALLSKRSVDSTAAAGETESPWHRELQTTVQPTNHWHNTINNFGVFASTSAFAAVRNEAILKPYLATTPGNEALLMEAGGTAGLKREMLGNLGTAAGALVANKYIDNNYFKDTPVSWTSTAVDAVSPAVLLTRAPWQVKIGAMVGAHVLTRYWDSQTMTDK